ncbi:MAG: DUF1016 domain-containing protein [Verrucomicrobia bacterium]|nr:DUF1016 domain-containing protein [Verrucomicrobiota bacterium]
MPRARFSLASTPTPRTYPCFAARRKLYWGHYRVLIDIEDPATRQSLELEADRKGWKTADLERRVRALNAIDVTPGKAAAVGDGTAPPKPLVPKRGTVGMFRVTTDPAMPGLAVDLGFTCYVSLPAATKLTDWSD